MECLEVCKCQIEGQSIVLLLIITPRKFLDCNMDSGEIVYSVVEEIIGKTGKCRGPQA